MLKIRISLISHILLAVVLCTTVPSSAENEDRKDYIVYMGKLPDDVNVASTRHADMLSQVLGNSYVPGAVIKTYSRSFNGIVVKLTEKEANKLKGQQDVVSVFPDRMLKLHTTRSWDFLGLTAAMPREATVESDIIIGVVDTGIWPESKSFNDQGFGPPPKKWKGSCIGGANFTCNNKLIGARFYSGTLEARDVNGHGSHTASIAAGDSVPNASFYGIAGGTARGGVPSARIAVYKACADSGCRSSDILAAFDDAIADGVDIITASLGNPNPYPIEQDVLAIGSFHAMVKGIVTTQSAGNSGASWQITTSTAPWILSVAASTIDRKIIAKVIIGNNTAIVGHTVNGFNDTRNVPILYGKDAGDGSCDEANLKFCDLPCIAPEKVSKKILVCDDFISGFQTAVYSRTAGLIIPTSRPDLALVEPIPSSALTQQDYDNIVSYHDKNKAPTAKILKSEAIDDKTAPLVASFSSRGPNYNIPDIMKPDVTAPGVGILAAFSLNATPTNLPIDRRRAAFNVLSGTSMSCPHVAGIAAYIKSFHPDWSPSIVKSAIMTTAKPVRQNGSNEFSYGSGHVDPVKALSPGLVYEITNDDYVKLLCTLGINAAIIGPNATCSNVPNLNARDMNYPSIVLAVNSSKPFSFNVTRTVTNVGPSNSTYKANLVAHPKVKVTVVPKILRFNSSKKKQSFDVSISGPAIEQKEVLSSSLVWSDGVHTVRSPIVAYAP